MLASGAHRREQEALSALSFKIGEMLQRPHHGTCKERTVQPEGSNNSHAFGQYKDGRGERRLKRVGRNDPFLSSPCEVGEEAGLFPS